MPTYQKETMYHQSIVVLFLTQIIMFDSIQFLNYQFQQLLEKQKYKIITNIFQRQGLTVLGFQRQYKLLFLFTLRPCVSQRFLNYEGDGFLVINTKMEPISLMILYSVQNVPRNQTVALSGTYQYLIIKIGRNKYDNGLSKNQEKQKLTNQKMVKIEYQKSKKQASKKNSGETCDKQDLKNEESFSQNKAQELLNGQSLISRLVFLEIIKFIINGWKIPFNFKRMSKNLVNLVTYKIDQILIKSKHGITIIKSLRKIDISGQKGLLIHNKSLNCLDQTNAVRAFLNHFQCNKMQRQIINLLIRKIMVSPLKQQKTCQQYSKTIKDVMNQSQFFY